MNANVQKVLDLEKQFQEAKVVAIQDLLKQRTTIDEQLKVLGHDGSKKPEPKKRETDPNKKCGTCGAVGHDGRFHKRKTTATPPASVASATAPKKDAKS